MIVFSDEVESRVFQFEPIGYVSSPFKEKFGIPRQPGLTHSIRAQIQLLPPYNHPDTVRGLEECSHIWIIFVFSATQDKGWQPLVRPPRLGGNQRLGVFATRSTFRPNPIGLSVAKLISIEQQMDQLTLEIADCDLLDGTPILDIKPYLPYADAITDASFTLGTPPESLAIPLIFSSQAEAVCLKAESQHNLPLKQQITEVLQCDPRPAYQKDPTRIYGIKLHDFNIRWQIDDQAIHVVSIDHLS